jgi:large subunit ribosomal protein L35
MALSLSLARAAPLAAVSASAGARRLPSTTLAFPPKSFFGAPLAATAASVASPLPRKPGTTSTSFAVVAAGKKGYKMKTHKVPSLLTLSISFSVPAGRDSGSSGNFR